ncbi:zinc ion binding protein [Hortaea werneckii]|nr:zinc ion binding protein [Hortaea werneckii]
MLPQHTSRNRGRTKGGPSGVQRSYASQLRETEALFNSYEHLQGLPRGDAALTMLRKVASLVKPIMRKRGWKVQILAEFLPPEQNLLGLNINKGYKICIRLRYHNNPDLFLPTEQVVDTMLHELSHNVWGDHDSNFHRLWDELRDEQETLMRKGYTGEGFLSEGHRLGGGRYGAPPPHEVRRLARASAEKRQAQGKLSKGSGQRLGGTPLHLYGDVRSIIADQVTQRNTINRGCASGRGDATKLAEQQGRTTFRTKAEEDDANDRAIAQALYELMEQEEEKKLKGTFSAAPADGGLAWHPESGLYDPKKESRPLSKEREQIDHHPSEEEQMRWALQASTNPSPSSSLPPSNRALSPISPLSPQNIDRTISAAPPQHHQSAPLLPDPTRSQSLQPPPFEKTPLKHPRTSANPPPHSPNNIILPSSTVPASSSSCPIDLTTTTTSSPPPLIDLSDPFNPNEWTCEISTATEKCGFGGVCGVWDAGFE